MRLLITGDRNWKDEGIIHAVLTLMADTYPDLTIIHGGANGADSIAGDIAESLEIKTLEFRADWSKHGRAAGPIRNQQMLDEGKPDAVMAFHKDLRSSRGTLDMVRRARSHNLPVTWLNDTAFQVTDSQLDEYLKTC
jgi:hypothetical protein